MAPWWWFPCKPKHVGAVLLILRYFNSSTFFNVVCISCILKCWILLMHSVTLKSTSTCFGHICSPSSGGILCVYNNWYMLCFSVDCLLAGWRNRLRKSSASSWFLLHRFVQHTHTQRKIGKFFWPVACDHDIFHYLTFKFNQYLSPNTNAVE